MKKRRKPRRTIISFGELVATAHETALENSKQFIIARKDINDNILILFNNRYSFIECYGLAEEQLFDEHGEFMILDSPTEKEFDYRKDLIETFTQKEFDRFMEIR